MSEDQQRRTSETSGLASLLGILALAAILLYCFTLIELEHVQFFLVLSAWAFVADLWYARRTEERAAERANRRPKGG